MNKSVIKKMQLFARKSKPKVTRTTRLPVEECPRIVEEIEDYKNPNLIINDKEIKFVDGEWICSKSGTGSFDDIVTITERIKILEEEKNMILLKNEVLLHMLTEAIQNLNVLKEEENEN